MSPARSGLPASLFNRFLHACEEASVSARQLHNLSIEIPPYAVRRSTQGTRRLVACQTISTLLCFFGFVQTIIVNFPS